MAFKIYTKTGDKGKTGLFGGMRVPKYDRRIEAYGTVDELNSCVGLLRDHCKGERTRAVLLRIQNRLFDLGSNLALAPGKQLAVPAVTVAQVKALEEEIDRMSEELPPLKQFILPGGHPTVSFAHLARTVCRRAEREVYALMEADHDLDLIFGVYLNRLSDYFFTLARYLSVKLGVDEIKWSPE